MNKYILGICTLLFALFSLVDSPINAVGPFCCSQSDPSTCAVGIGVDRYYCYATMAACLAGTCDAGY